MSYRLLYTLLATHRQSHRMPLILAAPSFIQGEVHRHTLSIQLIVGINIHFISKWEGA